MNDDIAAPGFAGKYDLLVYVRDGRLWTFVGTQPYKTADQREVELMVWSAKCAACEKTFTVLTPAAALSRMRTISVFGRIHCDEHKKINNPPRATRAANQ